jgi:hypothetical protein
MGNSVGEAFIGHEGIWHARQVQVFPHRRQVEFPSDTATNAQPLLEGLSYVTNSLYGALPLRRGYVEITERDFDTIQAALRIKNS